MGRDLDLDDVAAGHPVAMCELAELRREASEQRKFADTFQAYNDKHLRERNYYRDERDALKHDIERSQDRNTALIAENDALRALLAEARYGIAYPHGLTNAGRDALIDRIDAELAKG